MATSLADLVTKLRFQANMEGNNFVTDLEATGYLNDQLGELDDVMIGLYDDYKTVPATDQVVTSTSDTTNFFSVPADFLKCRAVHYKYAADWVPLIQYDLQDSYAYAAASVPLPPLVRELRYRVMGTKIFLTPWASASGTYRLWYVPAFQLLTGTYDGAGMFTGAGGSNVFLPVHMDTQAWHAFALAGAMSKVLLKQDLDASAFIQEKEAQRQRVITAAQKRDAGPPKAMRDTRRRRAWGVWRGGPFG